MKKTYILLLAFSVLFTALDVTAHAQTLTPLITTYEQFATVTSPNTFYTNTMDRYKSISVYPDAVLTYLEGRFYSSSGFVDNNYFAYNRGTTNLQLVSISEKVHMLDFEHLPGTDYVAFCGYVDDLSAPYNRIGLLGWFDISTLNATSPIAPTYNILRLDDYVQVERIVPYSAFGSIYFAAIGKKRSNNAWEYTFLQCNHFSNSTSPSIQAYPVQSKQRPMDIVRTENYLVFIGIDYTYSLNSNIIFIRKSTFNDFTNCITTADLDNFFYYTETDGDYAMEVTGTYMGNEVTPSGDMIIVGGQMNLNNGQYSSRYRVIDAGSMNNTNSQQFLLAGKMALWDMAYMHTSGMLATLQGGDPLTGNTPCTVLMLKPTATTNYTTDGIQESSNSTFVSLDNLNHSASDCVHFVMGGNSTQITWFLKNSTNLPSAGGCNIVKQYDIEPVVSLAPIPSMDANTFTSVNNVKENITGQLNSLQSNTCQP